MAETLKIFQRKDYDYDDVDQPLLLQEKSDMETMAQKMKELEARSSSDSKYFGVSDLFSYLDNSDESREDENYESMMSNGMITLMETSTSYELTESYIEENIHVQSTRFPGDIIFTLSNSKLFEFGSLALSSGIVASMTILPPGFDLAMSLMLSAPLLVCICGLCAKHHKGRD